MLPKNCYSVLFHITVNQFAVLATVVTATILMCRQQNKCIITNTIGFCQWLQPSVLNTGRCKCGPMWRITRKLLKDCRTWTYDSSAHGWSEKQRLPFSSPNDCIHEFYPAYLVVVVPVDRRTNRLSCFLPVRQML